MGFGAEIGCGAEIGFEEVFGVDVFSKYSEYLAGRIWVRDCLISLW